MNIQRTIQQLDAWHTFYCDRLGAYCTRCDAYADRPTYELYLRGGRRAGRYSPRRHLCQYSLPYALLYGARYEEVVAHECVHAHQCALMPGCKFHGELFLHLMRSVCGFRHAGFRHSMPSRPTVSLGKLLMLKLPHTRGVSQLSLPQLRAAACQGGR